MEILIFLIVMIVIWLRWSRYYTNKQIKNALKQVNENKAFRSGIKFTEYLRYFKLDMGSSAQSIDTVYEDKNITIVKDDNECVLMVNKKNENSPEIQK
ncbi:MAG: hypothetical protein HRT41_06315 [Campylobacteraceae bacterium]|nr:hypothetical protein [Campylobacteraceae bacterium]